MRSICVLRFRPALNRKWVRRFLLAVDIEMAKEERSQPIRHTGLLQVCSLGIPNPATTRLLVFVGKINVLFQ
jgi:hypothetical protein